MKHPLKVFEEKRKVVEIDVKQVIYFIREVSKEKIQNCWRKTQIAKIEEDIYEVTAAINEEDSFSSRYF